MHVRPLQVMPGLLLGGMLPFVFSGFTMLAVGRAAGAVIEEVRGFRTDVLHIGQVKTPFVVYTRPSIPSACVACRHISFRG